MKPSWRNYDATGDLHPSYVRGRRYRRYPRNSIDGIAIDAPGNWVYLSDLANHRIQKFSGNGTYSTKTGSQGTGNGQFGGYGSHPGNAIDLALGDWRTKLWVVDTYNHRVQRFQSSNLSYQTQWGSEGAGDGQFKLPGGIAVEGNFVYVADSGNHRVQVFNWNGVLTRKWGTLGVGQGSFTHPTRISVDADRVYVADNGGARVQAFTHEGEFVAEWTVRQPSGEILLPMAVLSRPLDDELLLTGPGAGVHVLALPRSAANAGAGVTVNAHGDVDSVAIVSTSPQPQVSVTAGAAGGTVSLRFVLTEPAQTTYCESGCEGSVSSVALLTVDDVEARTYSVLIPFDPSETRTITLEDL